MKALVLAVIITGLLTTAISAEVMEDVPPWHWAHDAVDTLVAARIIVGYPPNDADLIQNAVTQVYESFAHAQHPEAQAWAERFVTSLPRNWPEPLRRSPLEHYRLESFEIREAQAGRTVSFSAVIVTRRGVARARVTTTAEQDRHGRWRVNYASLVSAQPQIFK